MGAVTLQVYQLNQYTMSQQVDYNISQPTPCNFAYQTQFTDLKGYNPYIVMSPVTSPGIRLTPQPAVADIRLPSPTWYQWGGVQPSGTCCQQQAITSVTQKMEIVWHGEFDRLFQNCHPHQWVLMPTLKIPEGKWKLFKDSAKVRFSCQKCGHGWTSMKGRVAFSHHFDVGTESGYVMFKLFGQQCQKCQTGNFEHAMWYPEEVSKVVANCYNHVGQTYYGYEKPQLRIDRREGKPRNQHNAKLCQACQDGVCKDERV